MKRWTDASAIRCPTTALTAPPEQTDRRLVAPQEVELRLAGQCVDGVQQRKQPRSACRLAMRGQPQSDPGTGWGAPIVSTTGFPSADWNSSRAAIRQSVRGAAKDLLIRLSAIVSDDGAESLYAMQPAGEAVPTRAVPVHHLQVVDSKRLKLPTHFVDRTAASSIRSAVGGPQR